MKTLSSILWLIFSVLTIVVGALGLLIPLEVFASLVVFLPFLLLFGAIVNVAYYFSFKDKDPDGVRLLIIDAILSFLFAIIFFAIGVDITSLTLIAFVAFMSMFKGILALAMRLNLKRKSKAGYGC